MKLNTLLKFATISGALFLLSACALPKGNKDVIKEAVKSGFEEVPTIEKRIFYSLDILTQSAVKNTSGRWRSDRTGLGMVEYSATNELGSVCITTINDKPRAFNYNGDMPRSNTQAAILDDTRDRPGFNKDSLDYTHFFDEIAETSGRKVYHFDADTSEKDVKTINERYLRVLEELCRLESSTNALPIIRGKVYK